MEVSAEQLWAAAGAAAQDGMAVLDEHGVIVGANEALCKMLGRSHGELVGARPPYPWWPAEAPASPWALLSEAACGEPAELELSLRGPGGAPLRARLRLAPLEPAGAGLVLGAREVGPPGPDEQEARAQRDERQALARVAAATARAAAPEEILAAVAEEAARLVGAERALVGRFEGQAAVVAAGFGGPCPPGTSLALTGQGALARVAAGGCAVRIDDYAALPAEGPARAPGQAAGRGSGVAAPLVVGGRLWGAVLATADRRGAVRPGAERRLSAFAELASPAVAAAAARGAGGGPLARDPLTGLADRRSLEARLRTAVASARRGRLPLSLLLLDIDRLRPINDAHGRAVGDRVIAEVASRLGEAARASDLLARVGGEEFAWLMPGADELSAWQAAERARAAVGGAPVPGVGRVSVSVGVCGLSRARDADDLYRLAEAALYWAKLLGRDAAVRYTPEVDHALSADEYAERLQGSRALVALQLLARVVDARDQSTRHHSERVAALAGRLAAALGWPVEARSALAEAGLVHDIGKVGVPGRILLKPGRLSPAEYEQVKEHAALGARIVADALSPDQVAWVAGHHERYDGTGYPGGLAGEAIPLGARILAVADAWDVMTGARRLYTEPMEPAAAIAECRREAGRQFCPAVVVALERLWEAGELSGGRSDEAGDDRRRP